MDVPKMTMPSLSGTGPYTSALKRALQASIPELTKALHDNAVNSGWDMEDISKVAVREENGHLVISADDSVVERIMDVEYGTPEDSPKPAIRHFAAASDWHKILIANALKEAGL